MYCNSRTVRHVMHSIGYCCAVTPSIALTYAGLYAVQHYLSIHSAGLLSGTLLKDTCIDV
eukprot:10280-Heterococcus_DN1.PRE.2